MTDYQKWLTDILTTRRAWAWNSFHTRREFEWKVTLGIWTALAASISLILTKETAISPVVKSFCFVPVIFLLALHFFFLRGLTSANDHDREISDLYDLLLDKQIHLQELKEELGKESQPEMQGTLDSLARRKKPRRGIWNYSPLSQLLVTLLLGACVVSIIRSGGDPPSAHPGSDCPVVNHVGNGNSLSK